MAGVSSVKEMRKAQRADGAAAILAIGTANPPNCFNQADYPDYYFRVTNCEHMTHLKDKFKRICEKSKIEKRYLYLTEEMLKEKQNMCAHMAPSLDARQDIVVKEVPKLGKVAAQEALIEWGQPKSNITHLIFCTSCGIDMPGADHQLTKLLGLNPSVKRFMIYQQGGPAILDQIEARLGLKEEKLRATRKILKEYGNMSSGCVLFILDEIRKNSLHNGHSTTGQGLEWGVLFGFGPGVTVETVVLRSVPTAS